MPRYAAFDAARVQGRLWTPRELQADLRLWASVARGPTTPGTGSAIASLADLSQRGDFSQGTNSARPTWTDPGINGRPALTFGTGIWWDSATTLSLGSLAAFECAAVLTMNSATVNYGRFFSFAQGGQNDYAGSNNCAIILRNVGNNGLLTFHNSAAIASTAISLATPIVFRVSVKGGTCRHWLNGAAGGSGSMTPALGSGVFFQGRETADVFTAWNGLSGEIIFVAGTQPDLIGERLDGYLAWQWGLQGSLAAGHRYRNAPPMMGA